jgi:mannose-6-phosphate isomerase-like protein (cupin superfamily)
MLVSDTHSVRPHLLDHGSKLYPLIGTDRDSAKRHSVSYFEFVPGASCDYHHHPKDFEESYYILEGEALVAIGGEEYTLTDGQSMFMPPEVPHELVNVGKKTLKFLVITTPPWSEQSHIPD